MPLKRIGQCLPERTEIIRLAQHDELQCGFLGGIAVAGGEQDRQAGALLANGPRKLEPVHAARQDDIAQHEIERVVLQFEQRGLRAPDGGDVAPELAAFMADAQVPWGVGGPSGIVSEAAWRSRPSWYLISTDDRMIDPRLQRTMSSRAGASVTETPGSHSIYVSQPRATADVIEQAAAGALAEAPQAV